MFRQRRLTILICILTFFAFVFIQNRRQRFAFSSTIRCPKSFVEPDRNFFSNLIFISDLKLLFCDVPKAASTNLRRLIYLYLQRSNSSSNIDRKRIWIDEKRFFDKFRLDENSQKIFDESKEKIFKFLFVRHPFRRIYSVFNEKFVENHLDDTLSGWKQFEEDILLQMNPNENLISIRRKDLRLDLRTFLRYIIESIRVQREINRHWQRIVQRCAVCHFHYDWAIKIENFHQNSKILSKILYEKSQQTVEHQFPSKDFDHKGKNHSIDLIDSQLVQLFRRTIDNRRDFRILVNYYLDDFRIFDYGIPQID